MDISTEQSMEKTILKTAEKLFLEKGFALTSTTEIAKAVGCNQALVHYYFRTKENLFNIIFENKFNEFFKGIFDWHILKNKSFQEKIKFIIESHFDILMKNPKMPTLVLRELSRQPEQIAILREKLKKIPQKLYAELNAELQNEIKNGKVRHLDLLDLFISMISLNMSLFIMMPILENALQLDEKQKDMLILHRREENVIFILNSLRP